MRHLIGRRGNRKIPSHIGIFNLPRLTTCPGATDWCKRYCYARKAEYSYKQVRPYRELNYIISKGKDFVKLVNQELATCKKKVIRIHESGDFYNQAYLNKWEKIIKANPQIHFTFYTKSYALLDFSRVRRLKNVSAFASVDPTTPVENLKKARRWHKAYILGESTPKDTFVCTGSCKSCSYCYQKEIQNVGFRKH